MLVTYTSVVSPNIFSKVVEVVSLCLSLLKLTQSTPVSSGLFTNKIKLFAWTVGAETLEKQDISPRIGYGELPRLSEYGRMVCVLFFSCYTPSVLFYEATRLVWSH